MIKLNKHPLLITTKYQTASHRELRLLVSGSGVRIGVSIQRLYFPEHKGNLYYQFIEIKGIKYLLLTTKIQPNYYIASNLNNSGYILGNACVRALLYESKPHYYILEFEKTDNKDILAFKLIKQ